MAEKKFGLSAAMIIGSIAVGAAAGVAYYYRKNEIKKLAEDIIARVRPAEDEDDELGDWDIRSGMEPEDAETADVNIVDSGISLESVENPEEPAEAETESEPEADAESEPEAEEAAGEAEEQPESDAEAETEAEAEEPEPEQPKKKTWFWSK